MNRFGLLSLLLLASYIAAMENTKQIAPASFFDAARFGQTKELQKWLPIASKQEVKDALVLSASSGTLEKFNAILFLDYENWEILFSKHVFNVLFYKYIGMGITAKEKKETLNTCLYGASRYNGNVGLISKLIALGADVNFENGLPIKMAVENRHRLATIKLLKAGATIQDEFLQQKIDALISGEKTSAG